MRRLARLAIVMAVATSVASAHAQPQQPNKDAVAHFEAGRKLRDQGEKAHDNALISKARDEFLQSLGAQKTVGAYYNLGACYDMLGEYRKAVEAYREAVDLAKLNDDPRQADAANASAAVKKNHSWVFVEVRPEVLELPDLEIQVDGQPIPRAEMNGEVFRDAATHQVVASAKNRETFKSPPIRDRDRIIIKLENLPALPGVATGGGTGGGGGEAPGPVVKSGGWGWPQWTGLAAIVVGAGLGGYGAFKFGDIQARRNDTEQRFNTCNAAAAKTPPQTVDGCPVTPAQLDDYNSGGKDHQRDVILAFGVPAVVLIAGGIVLIAAGPSILGTAKADGGPKVAVTPVVGPSGSGLVLDGHF